MLYELPQIGIDHLTRTAWTSAKVVEAFDPAVRVILAEQHRSERLQQDRLRWVIFAKDSKPQNLSHASTITRLAAETLNSERRNREPEVSLGVNDCRLVQLSDPGGVDRCVR